MKNNSNHIVFCGGSTAGHLYPGLAVAEELAEMIPRLRVTFCGGGRPSERQAVAEAGFGYYALPSRPLPQGPTEAVAFVLDNLAGYMAAKWFLREERVAAVVGLGGYTSLPVGRAAARRGLPLVLLEQNVIPNKATRWLASRASLVCTSLEETAEKLRCRCPVRFTGNPVRRSFQRGRRPAASDATSTAPPTLVVLGGSGEARPLNEKAPPALYKVRQLLQGWRIVHQSGESGLEATRTLYQKLALDATVEPFLADMPAVLSGANLALCRAGGTTLAELAAMGVPAILLPYPHAANDQQAENARVFAAGGGCVTIDERKAPGHLDDELADVLCFVLANQGLRQGMSAAMRDMARPFAAKDVAELVWSLAASRAQCAEPAGV
ncbi:MAG: UDP-N-acetylglucosamine--N-acetylmuramyl-(pentapeptide) pyrophosphoryl-undecaprenol N-acetylglucosamine transferase [Thermoguttaceae bacterium]